MSLTVGSLFAGIGGFDLGLESLHFKTKWQVEIDEFCQFVLARHWPDAKRYRDVRHVSPMQLGYVDVICGGFPCQDISANNPHGTGIHGTRSGLWSEFARIIRGIRPRYVIIENSPLLASKGLDIVLHDLAILGYDAEWHRLGVSPLGAPHHRQRLWIVAYPHCQRRERPGSAHGLLTQESWSEWLALVGKSNWWTEQPEPPRVDDGFPNRLDEDWSRRVQASGNAVVPQIVTYIAQQILRDAHKV